MDRPPRPAVTTTLPTTDAARARVRGDVFYHLAGLAIAPTVTALAGRGIPQWLADAGEPRTIDALSVGTYVNAGYLRVALRLLASAGWLREVATGTPGAPAYEVTSKGRVALRVAPRPRYHGPNTPRTRQETPVLTRPFLTPSVRVDR